MFSTVFIYIKHWAPFHLYLNTICAARNSEPKGDVRRRTGKGDKGGGDGAAASGDAAKMKDETAQISVTSLAEVQSDLNPKDPFQKVVRFSPDLSLLLTGGTDGHIRVWEVNTFRLLFFTVLVDQRCLADVLR